MEKFVQPHKVRESINEQVGSQEKCQNFELACTHNLYFDTH